MVDKIVTKFPVKSIPRIKGEPNYESINKVIHILYRNTATLATPFGVGAHEHVGLIMKPEIYATLSETPYLAPDDPSQFPVFEERNYTTAEHQLVCD